MPANNGFQPDSLAFARLPLNPGVGPWKSPANLHGALKSEVQQKWISGMPLVIVAEA